ncbi:hypothetical protein [Streptomyces sp. NPDC092952]|uniref:hypothetical protein n=1 Tax=Streptomyces sp. NPDC092952 TaxID=3366018 RepID=UPI0037F5BCB0
MTAERLASNIDMFGGLEPGDSTTRVAVRVPVHLSFADLLGLLMFKGSLTWDELDDDSVVRESLQYAVLDTDLSTMTSYSHRAMALYEGDGPSEGFEYAVCLAAAITRVFGVSA